MIVSLIVAMDEKRGIGVNGRLPWRLAADMKRFRELTMGHHLIVGRKTYESIGKPLPGRQMIVITRDEDYRAEDCFVVHSLNEALALAEARGESEVFIGGGAQIYAQAIELADRLYLTSVAAEVAADTFFLEFDADAWRVTGTHHQPADERNQFPFTFKLLVRATQTESGRAPHHAAGS